MTSGDRLPQLVGHDRRHRSPRLVYLIQQVLGLILLMRRTSSATGQALAAD